jgi:hypothetical protein
MIEPGTKNIKVKIRDIPYTIDLSWQKTGYGQRYFFVCPICNKRYSELYIEGKRLKCRNCSSMNKYWGIQNSTKGGFIDITYRMLRVAEKQDIKLKFPFDYTDFLLDKRERKKDFRKTIRVLQALENMRVQTIFFKTTYPTKIIRLVLDDEHPLMINYSLQDIKKYLLRWY